jgi:hypothetical protein
VSTIDGARDVGVVNDIAVDLRAAVTVGVGLIFRIDVRLSERGGSVCVPVADVAVNVMEHVATDAEPLGSDRLDDRLLVGFGNKRTVVDARLKDGVNVERLSV